MSDKTSGDVAPADPATTDVKTKCESPPPAPMPVAEPAFDPRARLLQLAAELMRSNNRRLVVEYLRLRRMVA